MKREANCVVLLQLIGVVASVAKILFSLSFLFLAFSYNKKRKLKRRSWKVLFKKAKKKRTAAQEDAKGKSRCVCALA